MRAARARCRACRSRSGGWRPARSPWSWDCRTWFVGYSAAEKIEIIRLVEQSDLSVRLTMERLGIPRSTFYQWCDHYQEQGFDGLEDKQPTGPDPGTGPC